VCAAIFRAAANNIKSAPFRLIYATVFDAIY